MRRFVVCGAIAAVLLLSSRVPRLDAQLQTFRSGIAVVPLDVRVVDRKGNPINDLTKVDFTIYEDGVRQEVTHFERQTLSPMLVQGPEVLVPGTSIAPGVRTQNRRVFMIALGHTWVSTARFGLVDAMTKFLRERLLPQDYAAVSAFGRVTDITTDREALVQVILQLRALQKSIDDTRDFTEKRRLTIAMFANPARQSPELEMRKRLDAVFASKSGGTHLLSRGPRPEWQPLLSAIATHAGTADGAANPPSARFQPGGFAAGRFAQRQEEIRGIQSNVLSMFNALQYLRFVEGEKHLIYFGGGGFGHAVEDDRSVARIASDARVAIHMVQGWYGLSVFGGNLFADMQSKNIAALTGGQVFLNRYADEALTKIDQITRVGYLLAYSPSKSEADGRHRKIKIAVSRPGGATVMARQSYLATEKPAEYDEQQFAVQDRILTTAEVGGNVTDLGVKLKVTPAAKAANVDVEIDFAQIKATAESDRHAAKLEVVVFCSDARQRVVGEKWMTLDLKLKDDTFARALAEGFHHAASVPVSGPVRFVKVVVYDYATGRVGSVIARVN
jgi:VWFA-related protein